MHDILSCFWWLLLEECFQEHNSLCMFLSNEGSIYSVLDVHNEFCSSAISSRSLCGYSSVDSSTQKWIKSFTRSFVVQNLNYFLLQITKYGILKNVDSQTVLVIIDFNCMDTDIAQTIFIPQKRESHIRASKWQNFYFDMNYLFNVVCSIKTNKDVLHS